MGGSLLGAVVLCAAGYSYFEMNPVSSDSGTATLPSSPVETLSPKDVAGIYSADTITITVQALDASRVRITGRNAIGNNQYRDGMTEQEHAALVEAHTGILDASVELVDNRARYKDGEGEYDDYTGYPCTYDFLFEANSLTITQPQECDATLADFAVQPVYGGGTRGGVYVKNKR